uniref:Uncharacterized protein n=1 Tax=Oryzias melastigma TaxID=30732 RepID=A0A3B3CLN8_ORYME
MSCSLLEFCRLQELRAVRDFLFQGQKPVAVEERIQAGEGLSWDTSDWESAWDAENIKPEEGVSSTGVCFSVLRYLISYYLLYNQK